MPGQLIFASVPAGLMPGRSGYCTVARSRSIGDRLATELERLGAHEPGAGEAFAYRLLRIGADTVPVLTRYANAGPDYTGRASTCAHHLVFTAAETEELPPPADIARRFTGWLSRWDSPPRALPDAPLPLAGEETRLPALAWKKAVGDAGYAASLCDDAGRPRAGIAPAAGPRDALLLFAEAALLTEDEGWSAPFSTRADDSDSLWRMGNPRDASGVAVGRRAVMARTGVLPGARPDAVRKRHTKHTPNLTPLRSRRLPKNLPLYLAAGIASLAVLAWLAVDLWGDHPERGVPTPQPPEAPRQSRSAIAPAATTPAVDHALKLVEAGDWLNLCDALAGLTPAERTRATLVEAEGRLRTRLVPATLAAIEPTIFEPATLPGTTTRDRAAADLVRLRDACAKRAITPTDEESRRLARLDAALNLLSLLEKQPATALPFRVIWGDPVDTDIARTRTGVLPGGSALDRFLAESSGPFVGTLTGPAGALPLAAGPADFSAGKILALRHGELGKVIEIRIHGGGTVELSLRLPLESATPAFADTAANSLTLVDQPSGRKLVVRLLGGRAVPDCPEAPAVLLGPDLTLPRWLGPAVTPAGLPTGAKVESTPAGAAPRLLQLTFPNSHPAIPLLRFTP